MSNEEHGTVTTSDEPSHGDVPGDERRAPGGRASRPTSTGGRDSLNLRDPAPEPPGVRSARRRLRLRRRVQQPRLRRARRRRRRAHDRLAGLVAGRLRPLRPVLHPHDVARRRHLPRRRRSRRRRHRRPALRPAQQLARQRQPRQGPPPAVADQAEVRPEDLVGRPADLRRQPGARDDGLQDVRLRRRPRRHLGARGRRLLGSRARVARGRALQRRPRAGQPARRRADGPHLRQPRRAPTATPTRWRRPATSARRSPAWR